MSRRDSRTLMRTYPAPPKDFDPRTASDRLLRRYGFPRRPDPVKEPMPARLWNQAFERPVTFGKADLVDDPIMSARSRRRQKGAVFGPAMGSWGGAYIGQKNLPFNPTRGQVPGHDNPYSFISPASYVFGNFLVPEVFPADPVWVEPLTVAFWVGLDYGYDNELLQAGIAATVTGFPFSVVNYCAWTEWYSTDVASNLDAAKQVDNFPVRAGDLISVLVCAEQPDLGFVRFLNATTGMGKYAYVDPPGIYRWVGNSAEWVVEGISSYLPRFAPVTFNDCVGGSMHEFFNLVPGGETLEIVDTDPNGTPLTKSSILSPTSCEVQWLSFGSPPSSQSGSQEPSFSFRKTKKGPNTR